jgi:serine/threonine-protein kinase
MAEIYLAEDLRLDRMVAIKVLRPQYSSDESFLNRFLKEARAIAVLSHPNIVDVYDVGHDNGRYYIVMEYVPGRDLKEAIRAEAPFLVRRALDIARQLCLGVGHAHEKGIVHRDLKPQNVLLTSRDVAKVADFGIARAMAEAGTTEPGVVWGTSQYLSPEQARGEPATFASDVYGIGIILYEMLTGRVPFEGDDSVAIALQHIQTPPPPIHQFNPRVPRGVVFLTNKALEKDPAQRYPDGNAFAHALAGYMRVGQEVTAPRPAVRMPPRQPRTAPSVTSQATATPTTPARASRPAPSPPAKSPTLPTGRPLPVRRAGPAASMGIDWLAVFLGLLALLAVLGLIPLWAAVYARYSTALPGSALPIAQVHLWGVGVSWSLAKTPAAA